MKLFLAGQKRYIDFGKEDGVYILESFYYADKWTEKHIPFFKDFLLDSGAFTFFSSKTKNMNYEEYVDKYADFINRNNVTKFFELDIDKLIGYENVWKLAQVISLRLAMKANVKICMGITGLLLFIARMTFSTLMVWFAILQKSRNLFMSV